MNKIVVAIVGLVIIGGGIFFISNNTASNQRSTGSAPNTPNTTTTTEPTTDDNTGQTVSITYTDKGFEPNKITVQSGERITVLNSSSRVLDFASDEHPSHRINSELNIGQINIGETKSFVASKGTWGYHDHFNASATGVIVVE
jgi:plastocyanin